jgi:hypothetical protein
LLSDADTDETGIRVMDDGFVCYLFEIPRLL